ncbi:MAG: PQQ-dependent sugar dehydrogenase [Panacagrimonas sp.]
MSKWMKWARMAAGALAVIAAAGGAPAQAQEPPFGLTTRTPLTGVNFPLDLPTSSGSVEVFRPFHSDLRFTLPLYITAAPGNDNDLFVVEQDGTIRRFANTPGTRTSSLFIDLTDRVVKNGNERGLLGLAFHPDYPVNGYFYVYYTPGGSVRRVRLSRFRHVAGNPNLGDRSTETVLLELDQQPADRQNHNGGCIQFGPDGKIYIAVGDGGSSNDPLNNAQNINSPLGKLLRLNDDGSIPSNNPYVGREGRDEIWAIGLRNPWRFSFDPADDSLWLGDVGQNLREEIDIIRRNGNYGWRVYEANISNINPAGLPASAFDAPIFSYPRSTSSPTAVAGRSITGGYVYRGSVVPALVGKYVFADFTAGRVWALSQNNGVAGATTLVGDVPQPVSFGRDNQGNLYVASFDGNIYSFRAAGGGNGTPEAPARLSETGLFSDTATLTPNPGLIEYAVNATFWSDGTLKKRWIGLDGTSRITFSANGAWAWPRKAVVVKHFEIDLANTTRKRLETRVLFNGSTGWRGYTYRWNAAETDADLLPDSRTSVELNVADSGSPGSVRQQTYVFPSRRDCQECHTSVAGTILGAGNTGQMNRSFVYRNGVTDNQLRSFNHIDLFTQDIGSAGQYGVLTDPTNSAATLANRARAYLQTNCAQCHQPGGPTPVSLDLRASATQAQLNAINVRPNAGGLGLSDAFIIAAGSKERSVLWERMRRLDSNRMPLIGSNVVDGAGVELVGQWIDSLQPAGSPSISFAAASQNVSESAVTVTVRVQLSAASSTPVGATLSFGGAARSPADYATPPTSVTLPAGATFANVTLNLVNDGLDEANETLTLTLSAPTNASLGTRTLHTVTITDNDATPTVSFSSASQQVNESGSAMVRVDLSAVSGRTVTVPVSFGGSTASNPSDYAPSANRVSIAAGASSGTLRLTIRSDTRDEPNETIVVNMGTPTNAGRGALTRHTVTITDND